MDVAAVGSYLREIAKLGACILNMTERSVICVYGGLKLLLTAPINAIGHEALYQQYPAARIWRSFSPWLAGTLCGEN